MIVDTDKIASNTAFTVLSRLAMVFASTVGLPIGGWLLFRVVTAADTIAAKVDQTVLQVQLLDQSMKYGFDSAKIDIGGLRAQITDHEGRLRSIESDRPTIRRP